MVHIQQGRRSIGAWRRNAVLRSRECDRCETRMATIDKRKRGWPYTPDGSIPLLDIFELVDIAENMTTMHDACEESMLMSELDRRVAMDRKTWLKDLVSRWKREIGDV